MFFTDNDDGSLNVAVGFINQVVARSQVDLLHRLRALNSEATFDDIMTAIDLADSEAVTFVIDGGVE